MEAIINNRTININRLNANLRRVSKRINEILSAAKEKEGADPE